MEKDNQFDLQKRLTEDAERIVKDAMRATLKNPRESAYMVRFAAASRAASVRRAKAEERGQHIPSFLIASITSSCNLHCAGCYSRHNHATVDTEPVQQLSKAEWNGIFTEADELGISFILLAGGEPLLRRDVIKAAGEKPNILFPIFTNGTYMDEEYFKLFDKSRNLVPVMSIEGGRETTDERRGDGVYDLQVGNMEELKRRGLIFGISVTVTTENYKEVTSKEFVDSMMELGCKLIIFVEFVPVTDEAQYLAPGDEERAYVEEAIFQLRENYEMLFLSFPGDEKSTGGCIAAGRGFFHINSHGGAEPCPFSAYSDINVRNTSLAEAMESPLFVALRDGGILMGDHQGGCVLFEKQAEVEAIIEGKK